MLLQEHLALGKGHDLCIEGCTHMEPNLKFFRSHCHYPMEAKGLKTTKRCLLWHLLSEALSGIVQPQRIGLHVRNCSTLERAT